MDFIFDKINNTDSKPIRDIILAEIRNAIFEKNLKEGERLVENVIATNMGVSRTPVREALRQLEIEGLAINIPRKGTIVKGISQEDAIEIYDLREVLEGLAARLACLNISRAEIRKLKEIVETIKISMKEYDYTEYIKAHEQYNRIILNATKNKRLIDQMEHLSEYLNSLRKASLNKIDTRESVLIEHKKILKAIEDGDEYLAEKEARIHIVNAKKRFLESYKLR